MIDLEPSVRPTFDTLLHTSRGTVFPECFYSFLHNYVSSINDIPTNSPSPFSVPSNPSTFSPASSSRPPSTAPGTLQSPTDITESSLPSDSDHRMQRIWGDYESVEPYLIPDGLDETVTTLDAKVDYAASSSSSKPFQDILPIELHIPNRDSKLQTIGPRAASEGTVSYLQTHSNLNTSSILFRWPCPDNTSSCNLEHPKLFSPLLQSSGARRFSSTLIAPHRRG